MNWTAKMRRREMAYKVIVWSNSDQRITDLIEVYSFADGLVLINQIKSEDHDLDGWVCSYYRKVEEKAA
jgi:hypothetical protein